MSKQTKPFRYHGKNCTARLRRWPGNLELGPFEGLVAVTRGGLVPAAIVARELEIRLIDTACMASYHGQERGQVKILGRFGW